MNYNKVIEIFDNQIISLNSITTTSILDLNQSNKVKLKAELLRNNLERLYSIGSRFNLKFNNLSELNQFISLIIYCIAWYNNRLSITISIVISYFILFPSYSKLDTTIITKSAHEFTKEVEAVYSDDPPTPSPTSESPVESTNSNSTKIEETEKVKSGSRLLPIQIVTGEIADWIERWENALNPTPPFPIYAPRIRIAILILAIGSFLTLIPIEKIINLLTLSFGIIIFHSPLLTPLAILSEKFYAIQSIEQQLDKIIGPTRLEYFLYQIELLKDVPTNVQIALRLLRDAEAIKQPLSTSTSTPSLPARSPPPLPPRSPPATSSVATIDSAAAAAVVAIDSASSTAVTKSNGFNLSHLVRTASSKFQDTVELSAALVAGQSSPWENLAKGAVEKLRKGTGSDLPGVLLYVLPTASNDTTMDGKASFYAHYIGLPGHLNLLPPSSSLSSNSWTLNFNPIASPSLTTLSIPLDSLMGLKKVASLGWKARAVAAYLIKSSSHGSGLNLVYRRAVIEPATDVDDADIGEDADVGEGGEVVEVVLTAIMRRDELFRRVASLANVKWEIS